MSQINILIADDHQIVIEGLKMILEAHEELHVVAEVNNGVQVLSYLEDNAVDIVILDINMPEMDGIQCAKKIKKDYPKTRVIILTMYAQKSFIEEILKIGIDGCLLKNNTGKELADAIIRVHSGKSYFDQIQNFSQDDNAAKEYHLSQREIEIVKKLAEGLTSAQMAEVLFISEHTVKTHRKNILKKLNIHSSSELIQYALNNGII